MQSITREQEAAIDTLALAHPAGLKVDQCTDGQVEVTLPDGTRRIIDENGAELPYAEEIVRVGRVSAQRVGDTFILSLPAKYATQNFHESGMTATVHLSASRWLDLLEVMVKVSEGGA